MSFRWLAVASLLLCTLVPFTGAKAQPRDAIDCESHNYEYTRCDVPWRDARLVRQLSDTTCVRGRNWGVDRRGLWVDKGCAGRFVPAGRHRRGEDEGYGWRPGPGWDHRFVVTCESRDFRYRFCAVDLGGAGRARVARQISDTPCREGRSWGWNRAGIWVDQGCAAEFEIDRRWR